MKDAQVIILCGGQGMRIREETEFKPKPMITIGERPILWHIMKYYAHYGFMNFTLCLGYKGHIIKDFFLNYETMVNDFTIKLGDHEKSIAIHNTHPESGWSVTLAETGINAMTGARIKRVEKYVTQDYIMLTYGDGLSNVDLRALFEFHKSHKKIGTVTGVTPSSRFGELVTKGDMVTTFSEKPHTQQGLINGGFFIFDKRIFNYVSDDDNCIFERIPLERLASDGELMVYQHNGFWQCMDTVRDMNLLTEEWNSGKPAWKVWED